MNPSEQIIEEFYAAFAEGNPDTMASCYHPEIVFEDPAFGKLHGKDASDMWHMLIERAKGNLEISFSDIQANDKSGSAKWIAKYHFSKTNRNVVNKIKAYFDGIPLTTGEGETTIDDLNLSAIEKIEITKGWAACNPILVAVEADAHKKANNIPAIMILN